MLAGLRVLERDVVVEIDHQVERAPGEVGAQLTELPVARRFGVFAVDGFTPGLPAEQRGRLGHARLVSDVDFVRRLREAFQVVAIVEDFLPEDAEAVLRAALKARPPLRLPHLSLAVTEAYFAECSLRHGFGCGRGEIEGLAQAVSGFPLGMREAVVLSRIDGSTDVDQLPLLRRHPNRPRNIP